MKSNSAMVLLLSILFTSCATMISGTKQKITVTGNVDVPVQLLVDGQVYSDVKLPANVNIKRKNAVSKISAFVPNYNVEKQELSKTFNHVVWANAVGTVLFPTFMFVDWATGANKTSEQKSVDFNFMQAGSPEEIYNAYIDFGTECYDNDCLNMALSWFRQAYDIDKNNEIAIQKINAVHDRVDYLEKQAKLKAEKAEKRTQLLMGLADVLNATAEAVETIQSTQSSSSSYSSENSSESGGNSSRGGGNNCDCVAMQDLYNRVKKGVADEQKYYDDRSRSATTHALDGQNLRNIQQQKRDIEQRARKCGCNLQ